MCKLSYEVWSAVGMGRGVADVGLLLHLGCRCLGGGGCVTSMSVGHGSMCVIVLSHGCMVVWLGSLSLRCVPICVSAAVAGVHGIPVGMWRAPVCV